MSKFFGRKEPHDGGELTHDVAEPEKREPSVTSGKVADNRLADDLVRRVLSAIGDWLTANELDHLPPEIALRQAMAILNAMQNIQQDRLFRRHFKDR